MSHVVTRPSSRVLLGVVLTRLKEAGIVTDALLEEKMRLAAAATWKNGARLIVRAWVDPAFRRLLLEDGRAAVAALGYPTSGVAPLGVLENTPDRHHLVVCTLCSCYPRWLLGYPPHWYKSVAYRARAVRQPRGLLAEWGVAVAPGTEIRVVDSTADYRWMVLPMRPDGTDGWSEDELMGLVTQNALVGAEHCLVPGSSPVDGES